MLSEGALKSLREWKPAFKSPVSREERSTALEEAPPPLKRHFQMSMVLALVEWGAPAVTVKASLLPAPAALTTCHRLGGSNSSAFFLSVLEAGRPRPRCGQGRLVLSLLSGLEVAPVLLVWPFSVLVWKADSGSQKDCTPFRSGLHPFTVISSFEAPSPHTATWA